MGFISLENSKQLIAASLLAASVLDKHSLFEFKEAALRCGLRIARVRHEFCGTATRMLPDVVEHSVEFLFWWDRLAFFVLLFFCLYFF